MKTTLAILFIAGFAASAHCGNLTRQEQALLDKGLTMELYRPTERSGHRIEIITGSKGSGPVLAFVFGIEDAEAARKSGEQMAAMGYSARVAEQHLLAAAGARYHDDNFFVHCFMHEASTAYNAVVK